MTDPQSVAAPAAAGAAASSAAEAGLQRPVDPAGLGRVAVLYGGRSSERPVSLQSGSGVLAALRSAGVDAIAFDPAHEPLQRLVELGVDRAFIALHGRYGEDGTVQGALELLGIPYTGSGVMASAIAMDKIRTKQIWNALGLATPRHVVLRDAAALASLVPALGLPLILKPPLDGSSFGITKVTAQPQLAAAFAAARALDDTVLAEAYVDGRELTVAVIGAGSSARALPVVEIVAPGGNYDYDAKYVREDTRYDCPARLDAACTRAVCELAVAAYVAIGCEGWGRVDVMLGHDGRPMLLEVNTAPGMTSHSLVPMAARALGVGYDALVLQLAAAASLKVRARTVPPPPAAPAAADADGAGAGAGARTPAGAAQ